VRYFNVRSTSAKRTKPTLKDGLGTCDDQL